MTSISYYKYQSGKSCVSLPTTLIDTMSYAYDGAGRVASRSSSNATNPLFQSVLPTAMTSATYSINDQLATWTVPGSPPTTTNFTYDNNGNMTAAGSTRYTWDDRNRLTATGTGSFTYDPTGRRTATTELAGFVRTEIGVR